MKKLVFKEVLILSKLERAARRETFDPTINLLTGENDVGKSTLIKSLYHTLGADVPGLQNTHWKNARPIYCVRFTLGGVKYTVLRDEKYFGFFGSGGTLLGKFAGISGKKGIAQFINPLLKFRIELERSEDGKLPARPSTFFLSTWIKTRAGRRAGHPSVVCSSLASIGRACLSTISVFGHRATTTRKRSLLSCLKRKQDSRQTEPP